MGANIGVANKLRVKSTVCIYVCAQMCRRQTVWHNLEQASAKLSPNVIHYPVASIASY